MAKDRDEPRALFFQLPARKGRITEPCNDSQAPDVVKNEIIMLCN